MTLALALARRALAYDATHLDGAAIAAAKTAIIDAVGVTLLGAVEDCTRIAASLPGVGVASGPCSVFGTNNATSSLDAALLNGIASHALDYDDFTQAFGGHPTVPILPALWALAQERGASGRELIAAYIVGVELETRIAHGVHFTHYDKGWHPTATLGIFGAVAACASLLGLDEERTAIALAMAASLAAGVKANFGTMTKPLHVGQTARNGLFATLLAERGFTANLAAFEAPQGFLACFNGAGTFATEKMLVEWFAPPLAVKPGISLKQFPCCGSTHPAIHLALQLVNEVSTNDIADVDIRMHPLRLPHINKADPQSSLDAKFSLQYCVARALLDGDVRLAHFEGEAPYESSARALMKLCRVSVDEAMAKSDVNTFGARLIVTMRSGEKHERFVEQLVGRGPDNPMSEHELGQKFRDCALRAIDEQRSDVLWVQLRRLEQVDDIRSFNSALLTGETSLGLAASVTAE